MDFSEALNALKQEKHVFRKSWWDSGIHLCLISDDNVSPCILQVSPTPIRISPWLPLQHDLFANDWMVDLGWLIIGEDHPRLSGLGMMALTTDAATNPDRIFEIGYNYDNKRAGWFYIFVEDFSEEPQFESNEINFQTLDKAVDYFGEHYNTIPPKKMIEEFRKLVEKHQVEQCELPDDAKSM
jgi:hypothetical protein